MDALVMGKVLGSVDIVQLHPVIPMEAEPVSLCKQGNPAPVSAVNETKMATFKIPDSRSRSRFHEDLLHGNGTNVNRD